MKPCADLQQTSHTTTQLNQAGGRRGDPGKELEKGGLPGSVFADDSNDLALPNAEVYIFQRPNVVRRVIATCHRTVIAQPNGRIRIGTAAHPRPHPVQIMTERARPHLSQPVLFGQVFYFYGRIHRCLHTVSMKVCSTRLNVISPSKSRSAAQAVE